MAKSTRGKRTSNKEEHMMAVAIDDLDQFERFKQDILPKLRRMVAAGASAPEIYEFAQSHAAARMVTEALTNPDASKALVAIKDLLDRTQGKAKERVDVRHKYENMRDEELDALLKSKLSEAAPEKPKSEH